MHSHLSFLLHLYCCSPQKSRSRLVRSHQINRACCAYYDTYSKYPMITISLQEGKASGCRDKLGCHIKRAANTWITLCDGWLEGKHNDDSHIIVPLTPNPSSLRAARHMGKQSRSDWEAPCGRKHWVYSMLSEGNWEREKSDHAQRFSSLLLVCFNIYHNYTSRASLYTFREWEKDGLDCYIRDNYTSQSV